jgi:hypothetical protein
LGGPIYKVQYTNIYKIIIFSHHPEIFDWYQIYPNIVEILAKYLINKNDKVLHIGAGSSSI